MEAASQNTEKPKRGRPCIFPGDHVQTAEVTEMAIMFRPVSSRTKVNRCYAMIARVCLDDSPRFDWIMDKPTILTELGRIRHKESIIHLAEKICAAKPVVKIAVQIIRKARLGQSRYGNADVLYAEVLRLIKAYRAVYRDMPVEGMIAVLDRAREYYVEVANRMKGQDG